MTYIEFLEGVGRAADKISPKSIYASVLFLYFQSIMSDESKRQQPLHLKIEAVAIQFYNKIMNPSSEKAKFNLLKEPLFIDGKLNTQHY